MALNSQERKALVACLMELEEGIAVEDFVIVVHTHDLGVCNGSAEIGTNNTYMVRDMLQAAIKICEEYPAEDWTPDDHGPEHLR